MELTKEALAGVKFRTRGRWYDAQQVDQFIEELIVAADQSEREAADLRRELRDREARLETAREEAGQLHKKIQTLEEAAKIPPAPESEERQRRVCQELEAERDQLIVDIKALRRFRESFRQAVERDAQELLDQVGNLASENML